MDVDTVFAASSAAHGADASFNYLFQSHPVPMGIVDPVTLTFLHVNSAAMAQYGYSYSEFLRLTWYDIGIGDAPPPRPSPYKNGHSYAGDVVLVRHRRRDGSMIDVAVRSLPTEFERRSALLLTLRDSPRRKTTGVEPPRESQLLPQMPVGIILTDLHRRIHEWTGTAEDLLGYAAIAVVGKRLDFLRDPQADKQIYRDFWEQLLKSGVARSDLRALNADGHPARLHVSASQWRDGAGEPRGIIWVVWEAHEQRLQEQLEQQRLTTALLESELLEVVAMSEVRDKLTAMMAHEFKTPLSAIKLYRDIIARHGLGGHEPRVRDALDRIDVQVTTLVDMINDLLLLNQHSSGKLSLDMIRFDLVDLCAHVADHWQSIMGDRYLFIFHRPRHAIEIEGDLKLLKRVLDNLMSNAVKYSSKGGRIQLSVAQVANDVVIRVKDEGIGIPEEAQARIFEMFERADNALHLGGTGVGLAFCRMAVDMHGGRIGFESAPGKGTMFTVLLPLER